MVGIRRHRGAEAGFTLAELMAVVTIVAVLAVLAVYGVRKYVFAAKASEAMHMIGLIKAAQESYKDETFTYLNVSGSLNDFYPRDPTKDTDRKVAAWSNPAHADATNWRTLGVESNAPVEFGYAVVAGAAGDNPPNPGTDQAQSWPENTTEPWYVIKAVADRDKDGQLAILLGSSFTSEIYAENESE